MTQIERAFVLLFADSMNDLAVSLASAKINAALNRFNTLGTITTQEVDEAIEQIITEMAWEKTMEALQGGATRLLQAQIIKGGGISANIPKSIATRFAFDAVDDRAVLWAEAQAGALIREIDDETRTAIKKIVVDSLKGGYSGDDAAEMVSRIIGLNTRQTLAVENLYQNTVKTLTEDGVSARQARSRAKKMAAEYRERLIEYRGKMIARTEIMRAANNGRLLSWAQALDDGLIASTMLKEWRTYPGFGARGPCPICLELRGTTVEIFSEFPNGSMMPPAHPFCRCTSVLVPPTRGTTRTAQVGGGYVGPIDPIGAVLSQEVDSTVEKANPYHDPKTGRFTHAPTGSRKVEIKPVEENYSLTGTPNWETGEAKGTITIERVEGTGGEAADDWISAYTGSSKGRNRDAVENDITVDSEVERNWYTSSQEEQAASAKLMGLDVPPLAAYSALSNRPAANQLHSAIHAAKRPQPSVFRGVREPLVGSINGEPQTPRVGDSLVLPLTSFSRDRKVAFGFTKEIVGVYRPQAIQNAPKLRDGSTMVRIRPGGRGYSLSRAGLGDDKTVMLDELEVISAGRFRVTGTAVIRVTHPDLPGPREMTIIDLEHTDVWNPDTGALEPLTIAKAKFRDFGGSLAHLFIGRQIPENAEDFQKANPYHDPRTGRFTFAPANDMGGGGGALTPMGEREAFAERIRKAREDLGDIDYTLGPPVGIGGPGVEAATLQKQIEFGHIVRTEIDRRMAAAVSSPEHSARVEELKRAEELVHDEMGRLIARKETMFAERERRRTAVVEAEQAMNRARDTSPDYNRVKARYDEVRAKRDTAFREFRSERDRLGDQYDAANPHNPEEMSLWTHMERRDNWIKEQPSYQRAYDQHTLYRDEADKWKRYLDEVDHNGVRPTDLNGSDGPGSRTPLKVSDDNPLKRDPFLMEALDAQTAARKSLKEYDADSYADQMNALWEKKRAAESASNAFSGQTRRRIIKETLEDAGVEFSDGRVVFYSSSRDSDFDSGSIIMLGQKRSKAVRSIEEVAPYMPKRWAQDIQIAAKERGRMALTIKFDRNKRGEFGNFEIRTDGANTSLHELMHAVEASNDRVPAYEAAFFRYRTRGETAVRLKDLRPKLGYKADEMAKPDEFYNPYVGKIYGGRYHELLTMTYADMMYQRGKVGFDKLDPELQAWLWSTVILA